MLVLSAKWYVFESLQLLHGSPDFLLKTGTAFAIFSADGKIPFEKDLFNNSDSGKDIISLSYIILFV